jgi:hypothetical protein
MCCVKDTPCGNLNDKSGPTTFAMRLTQIELVRLEETCEVQTHELRPPENSGLEWIAHLR